MRFGTICFGLASVILLAGVGSTGGANPSGPWGPDGSGRPMRMLISGQLGRMFTLRSELQLSDEQRSEIKTIVQSRRDEIVAVVKPMAEKRRAMRNAVASGPTDDGAIRAAADELGKAISEVAVVAAKIKADVHGALTAEQREKIGEFREQADSAVDDFLNEITNPE